MNTIKIYLRSIVSEKANRLMLFDSNRNGAINELVTLAKPGSSIIWKTDRQSGIKKISRIYSKTGKGNIFHAEPRKIWFFNMFSIRLSLKAEGEESYAIDYLLCDGTRVSIDPTIKIPPPHIDD
jgi:hypothetical protein